MNARRRARPPRPATDAGEPPPLTTPPGARAPIGWAALRAAAAAHRQRDHHGQPDPRCPVCARYTRAAALARTREEASP